MKTIREIAEELGVSKQAVYKRYRGKLYASVMPYTREVGGTIYIGEQGERVIKQDFLKDDVSLGDVLNGLFSMLQSELKIINWQLAELISEIKMQSKSVNKASSSKPPKRKKQVRRAIKSIPVERLINKK